MQKDMNLHCQAEDILTLQQSISRLELQVHDFSMNAQNNFLFPE